MSMRKYCTSVICIFVLIFGKSERNFGQANPNDYRMYAERTPEPVLVDGVLDEAIWSEAQKVSDFKKNFPNDREMASSQTEVMMSYDGDYIYIAAICYDDAPGDYIVQSLKRDFNWYRNDNFSLFIDTFDDHSNGFAFAASPYGVQYEALISNGDNLSSNWDNKWQVAVKAYDDYWVAEFAIPFKTIRFNEDAEFFNINFARNDLKHNERSSWRPVPFQFRVYSLNYTGRVIFESPLQKTGGNIALIPYAAGGMNRDFQTQSDYNYFGNAGLDAKMALSSAMNLDLTINPDFSDVEVDQQVTNLSRFELFFPERRQFFLENSDLFANNGFSRIRPFFSRRIGLTSPIIAGARASGKVGKDWRLGLMNVQTGASSDGLQSPENFTVATFQKKMFAASNLDAIFVNKEVVSTAIPDSVDADDQRSRHFNRVIGVDYNLLSADNKWSGKIFYHHSLSPEDNYNNFAQTVWLRYSTKALTLQWNHEIVGENFNAEVGYVPRRGHYRWEPHFRYNIFPENSASINRISFGIDFDAFWDTDFSMTDRITSSYASLQFLNTGYLYFRVSDEYIYLFNDFDPTNSGEETLPEGSDYNFRNAMLGFRSDTRKPVFYYLRSSYGGYFNGERFNVQGEIDVRYTPYGMVALAFNYNRLRFPEPFNDADFFLIGPRFDITFTDKLFLTTFIQYNNQIDNVNLNTRFQWRFKPVSDLFLVYTDNYLPENFFVKNRSIVLKVSYWLSV